MCFFSPSSANESPLSLLRFKFIEQAIVSASLFFLAVAVADDLVVEVVAVVTVVTVVAVVGFGTVVVVGGNFFMGVFFFVPPLTTWVQPSSSLSGWSSVLGLVFSLVNTVVAAAAAIVVVVVVVVVIGVVVLVVF